MRIYFSSLLSGGCPRDDDNPEHFGGAVYLYNEHSVQVSVPSRDNDEDVGSSIYTGQNEHITEDIPGNVTIRMHSLLEMKEKCHRI